MANPALIGRYRFRNGVIYLLLSLWIAFSLFSFLWIIMTSIKSNKELYAGVWSIPGKLHLENYAKAWNVVNLKRYFLNSVLVTFSSYSC
jgi:ABC-type glycerol-3-phosphate transport system permease component